MVVVEIWHWLAYQGCFSVVAINSPDMKVGNLANPRSSPACFSGVFLEAALVIYERLVVSRGGDELPGGMGWCCRNQSHVFPVVLGECSLSLCVQSPWRLLMWVSHPGGTG